MNKIKSAFSLIELMIVITIIGILAAVAVPSYNSYVTRAKVIEAYNLLQGYKPLISEFAQINNRMPNATEMSAMADMSYTSALIQGILFFPNSTTSVVIGARLNTTADQYGAGVTQPLINLQAVLNSNGSVSWRCGTGFNTAKVDFNLLPSSCNYSL